jgi:hypothetical protein
MKLRTALAVLTVMSLSACGGLDDFSLFPDEYVVDQFTIFSVDGNYALGTEVRFDMRLNEGDTRTPALEITGTALRIDETDSEGIVHATAAEEGSGQIIYTIGGEEVRRHSYRVSPIAGITVEHFGLDGLIGFELENGEFDPSAFSIAMGQSYGLIVRYQDALGENLGGEGLLSSDRGIPEFQSNRDTIRLDTSVAGESTIELSAGDATSSVAYDVVDEIASLVLELKTDVDDVISIVPRATDAEGRLVYGKPDWRIDGQDYALILLGFEIDAGYISFEPSTNERHIVEASLLGMTSSIEAGFVYTE